MNADGEKRGWKKGYRKLYRKEKENVTPQFSRQYAEDLRMVAALKWSPQNLVT